MRVFQILAGKLWLAINRERRRRHWQWWRKVVYDREILEPLKGVVRSSLASCQDVELGRKYEKKVKSFWKTHVGYESRVEYYQLLKVTLGKLPDLRYVPDCVWYYILPFLNPLDESRVLEDKSKYGFYFQGVNRPTEIVRKIRGVYYDKLNQVVNESAAFDLLVQYGRPVILKPTIDSMQGRSVRLLKAYSRDDLEQAFQAYGNDFTVQEQIVQDKEMARFNETSLNSFRLTTLFLNGRFSVLSSIIRVGRSGAFVDNVGAGGYAVGVHDDGAVHARGYNAKGDFITKTYDGELLGEIRISTFPKVRSFVKSLHERLPYVPMIGWDIGLRTGGEPVLVELNATIPSIWFEQLCTGPLFGERFDEVMEFVGHNRRHGFCRSIGNWRPDAHFLNFKDLI